MSIRDHQRQQASPEFKWDAIGGKRSGLKIGTEHVVELSPRHNLAAKTTIPEMDIRLGYQFPISSPREFDHGLTTGLIFHF